MAEKVYYAKDQLTAFEQIKTELGPDAIIVKSRRVMEHTGFLGLFKKPMYEVVVNYEPEDLIKAKEAAEKQATVEERAVALFSDLDERAKHSGREKPESLHELPAVEAVSAMRKQAAAKRLLEQMKNPAPAAAPQPGLEQDAAVPEPPAEPKKPAIQKEQFADIISKAADEMQAGEARVLRQEDVQVTPAHVSREAKLNAYIGMANPMPPDGLHTLADQLPAATVELENRPAPAAPVKPTQAAHAAVKTAPAVPAAASGEPAAVREELYKNQRVAALEQAASAKKRGRGRPRKDEQRAAANEPKDRMESLESSVASLSKDLQMLREVLVANAATAAAAPAGPLPNQAAPLVKRTAAEREIEALSERLMEQDVDRAVAKKLAHAALGYMQSGSDTPLEAMNAAIRDVIGKPKYIRASTKATRSVILFGPTGVGKTTTLAKLAAQNVLERQASVAMVNADVFRVGAQEQLSVYADILKIPVRTIYKAEDIQPVLEEFAGKNFVFIDTCGKPTQDPEYQAEIQKLVECGDIQDKYLVISSTSSARVIREIVDSFRYIPQYKLIVTKLDESGSYGSIVNLCSYSGQPIAYLATGQNVPDDIVRADVDDIIQRLWR